MCCAGVEAVDIVIVIVIDDVDIGVNVVLSLAVFGAMAVLTVTSLVPPFFV